MAQGSWLQAHGPWLIAKKDARGPGPGPKGPGPGQEPGTRTPLSWPRAMSHEL